MPRPIVLVTEPEYRRGEMTFGSTGDLECVPAPPAEDDLAETITKSGARYLVVGSVPYRDRLYAALPRGAVLARYGVGHETVDKVRATTAGVFCTNTPDVLQQSVAELTLSMIGAAARHLLAVSTDMVDGNWRPKQGVELQGKTLAVIGCGEIGRAVARIARAGFGMRVAGYRRRASASAPADVHFDVLGEDFSAAVGDADFVSLHIPGSPENTRFINRERLGLMPERAWLINTARGAVVDEAALYDALIGKRLAGAALDVFEREPYEPADPARDLRSLPQALLLPHVGSNTAEANARMAERALRNIRLAMAGDVAGMDLLNPEVVTADKSAM
jgi:phosphoglycerate dehydrogenase-like enzyme